MGAARREANRFIRQNLREVRKSIAIANAIALTKTAQDIRKNETKRLDRVIDRPTPFTKRAYSMKRATVRKQRSEVFAKDRQAAYLERLETGGTALPKRRALLRPANAKLNKHGNLTRNYVKRELAKSTVFSATIKGVPGIWQRFKSKKRRGEVRLLVRYDDKRQYKPQLGFRNSATKTAKVRFPHHHRAEMRKSAQKLRSKGIL